MLCASRYMFGSAKPCAQIVLQKKGTVANTKARTPKERVQVLTFDPGLQKRSLKSLWQKSG